MSDAETMARWFTQACQPQLNRYNQRMADAAPYRNAPRWERERAAALREFEDATSEAAKLYRAAMVDLDLFGEISEATDEALTKYQNVPLLQMAAE